MYSMCFESSEPHWVLSARVHYTMLNEANKQAIYLVRDDVL